MDMQMPVMDGITATREIKKLLGNMSPIIIALTANVMDEHAQEATNAGMSAFITKPFRARLITEKMMEFLDDQNSANA
jgi:CheY-like chemotaxis protein